MELKWYLQTWFIVLMFLLWPFVIPVVIGVFLAIKQYLFLREMVSDYGEYADVLSSISSLRKKYDDEKVQTEEAITTIRVEFEQKKYDIVEDFEAKKKVLEKRLNDLNAELKTLFGEILVKNYTFSDYDGISSEECKNKLAVLKQDAKKYISDGTAITITSNGTKKEITDNQKQIIRCFDSECNNVLLNLSVKNIDSSRSKITSSFETLNKIFKIDGVQMNKKMLELKLEELNLVYTYELKKAEEKEQQRAIKERMIEEELLRKEIEKQKKKIEKDQAQFNSEISKLMKYMQTTNSEAEKRLYIDKIKELEEKLKALEEDKKNILEREANATAGYVYVISNIGSFGEDVYKIGMTRRLEPMDRVKELSSASVPFAFDVHAMIFSDNAPALESSLHEHFKSRSVNRVNYRKEFFRVSLDEIEEYVKNECNNTTEFTKIPAAAEYRETLRIAESEM